MPLYSMEGNSGWVSVMKYNCSECKRRCQANDPRFLLSLPAHLRYFHPVDPRYADFGDVQVDKVYSCWARNASITHLSPEQFAKLLLEQLGEDYMERIVAYIDILTFHSPLRQIERYPPFFDWLGKEMPPNPAKLRTHLHWAEQSTIMETSVSDYDQHV